MAISFNLVRASNNCRCLSLDRNQSLFHRLSRLLTLLFISGLDDELEVKDTRDLRLLTALLRASIFGW